MPQAGQTDYGCLTTLFGISSSAGTLAIIEPPGQARMEGKASR